MASETSDLTFVRCPTCRSLVPASASRCRICNAALEAGGKLSGEATAGGNRVRQKTVSASPDEVASIVSASTPKPAAPPPPTKPVVPLAPAEDPFGSNDDGFDPLGAYLQDLDSEPSRPAVEAKEDKSPPSYDMAAELDDLDDFDLDIFDDPPTKLPVDKVAAGPQVDTASTSSDSREAGDVFLEPPLLDEAQPSAAPPKQAAPPQRKDEPQAPKQDNRPPREPHSAQKPANAQPIRPKMTPARNEQRFQAPKREDRPAPKQQPPKAAEDRDNSRNRPSPSMQAKPQQQSHPQRQAQSQHSGQQSAQRHQHKQPNRETPPAREAHASPEDEYARHDEAPSHEERENRRPHGGNGPRTGRVQPGRLFGWLVSFENQDGRAIELRGGRFFITGSNIRESDLILEDQSISTPHALMSITDRGLMIQDLMSERGTFIRSSGNSQYRREEGVIDVEHGDWIRFGDVEFLVVIVPTGD
jgi:hypothetical protein